MHVKPRNNDVFVDYLLTSKFAIEQNDRIRISTQRGSILKFTDVTLKLTAL